jgi:hydroxylaminobenzene mutase
LGATRCAALQFAVTLSTMKRLTWWGTLLFLLGLLTGLMLAMMPGVADNPRGVLSGHLEGVMNGMFLIIVGLMADRVRLSTRASAVCVGLLLYGTFVNWFTTTMAGILGASQAMPIAGAGHHAAPVVEQVVLVVLVSVAFAMIGAVGMLLFGLRRGE